MKFFLEMVFCLCRTVSQTSERLSLLAEYDEQQHQKKWETVLLSVQFRKVLNVVEKGIKQSDTQRFSVMLHIFYQMYKKKCF